MLDVIRKKSGNWVITGLVVIIILVFALWGFERSNRSSQSVIAHIGDETISINSFRDEFQALGQQYNFDFSKNPQMKGYFKSIVLNQMIYRIVFLQKAKDLGFFVSNEELKETIIKDPSFQKNGKFDYQSYKRYATGAMEDRIRNMLLMQKLNGFITESVKASKEEIWRDYVSTNEKVNLTFLKIKPTTFENDISISEQEKSNYLAKEETLKKAKDYYATHTGDYNTEKKVRASQILIKTGEKDTKELKDKAEKKMQSILIEAKSKDFSKLAFQYSEAPDAKSSRGDMGLISKGKLIKPLDEAIFTMKINELSKVIQTSEGLHILKVTDIIEGASKSFDQVKTTIAQKLVREEKAKTLFDQRLKEYGELFYSNKLASTELKKYNLKHEETGFFDRSQTTIPTLGFSDDISKIAFELTKESPVSRQPYKVNDSHVFIKLKDRKDADLKKFEAEFDTIKDKHLKSKSSTAANSFGKILTESIKVDKNEELLQSL